MQYYSNMHCVHHNLGNAARHTLQIYRAEPCLSMDTERQAANAREELS